MRIYIVIILFAIGASAAVWLGLRAPEDELHRSAPVSGDMDAAIQSEKRDIVPANEAPASGESGSPQSPDVSMSAPGEASLGSASQDQMESHFIYEVAGRPFPIAPSLITYCDRHPIIRATNCVEVRELLARFADEPRDDDWATSIEAKIRSEALQELPDANIVALECRASLCVIEVTSSSTLGLGLLLAYKSGRGQTAIDLAKWIAESSTDPVTGESRSRTLRVFGRTEPNGELR